MVLSIYCRLLEVMQQNAQEDKARIMVLYSRFLREMEKVRDLSLRARQLVQEGILYYRVNNEFTTPDDI